MIALHLIQKAIIAKLKSSTPILALVPATNIVELNFQGQDIGFPKIVVDLGPQAPEGDGTDHKKLSRASWSVSVFTEDRSSFNASKIISTVIDVLFDSQPTGYNEAGAVALRFLRTDVINSGNPLRLNNRLWKVEAFFESTIFAITDDPFIPS